MRTGQGRNRLKKRIILGLIVAVVLIAIAFTLLPTIVVEAFIASLQNNSNVLPMLANPKVFEAKAGSALGVVIDNYGRVQMIAPDTYAIGEPQDNPDN